MLPASPPAMCEAAAFALELAAPRPPAPAFAMAFAPVNTGLMYLLLLHKNENLPAPPELPNDPALATA